MSKKSKYWKNRFGDLTGNTEPYHHHFDCRRIDDLDDEGLAYLLTGVKGINMLDLNETEITNESIKLLTQLEYVTELRAKGTVKLTDACAPDLNRINGLEFLHVKNTGISIDGLLLLKDLQQLKTILFSEDNVESIKEKMLQLKEMHPHCEFIIDGKVYKIDVIAYLTYVFKAKLLTYRIKIKDEPLYGLWSAWLTNPQSDYYETENQGPYFIDDIEWIEINPIEKIKEGELFSEKEMDHSAEIIKLLEDMKVPVMGVDGIVRVYIYKGL